MAVPDHEQTMWEILKERSHNESGRTIRIARYANVHKKRATDITKHWEKHDLVRTHMNGARATLTKKGTEVSDLSEVL